MTTTNEHPSSLEEKKANNPDTNDFIKRRWIFVHELKSILSELDGDDWVIPNDVGNLTVMRDGHKGPLAAIDFLWTRVEWFDGE